MKQTGRKNKMAESLTLFGGVALIFAASSIEFKIIGAVLVIIYFFIPRE